MPAEARSGEGQCGMGLEWSPSLAGSGEESQKVGLECQEVP